MAYIKYAGEEAVGRIADYVNKKLAFASSMPESPDANTIVMYVGANTSAYKQGGIYQYDGTEWNLINLVKTIELTQVEYDALPSAAKLNGTIYFVTDGSADGSIISGYYNETDGEFYAEETYETQYDHHSNTIYIDLSNNTTYIYDFENEEYVQVGGGGSGTVIKYVSTLPVTGIEDIIYGIKGYNSFEETIANGFLDENILFEKENDLSGGYIYTPAEDVILDASNDGTTYKGFISLAYDGVSDWTLTFDDATDITLADGDTFYFKQLVNKFFAGDATNQKIIPFGNAGGSEISYTAGDGIEIENYEISVTEDRPATFVGTTQEWDALTAAEKAQYKIVHLTNDVAGGEMVVVDTVEDGNLNPVTSNAVYDFPLNSITNGNMRPATSNAVYNFPIDSITNGSLRPVTSNAVRDILYNLEDSLKYRHINGTALSPLTSDPYIYYNANSLSIYFLLNAGDYTCNQLYNDNYFVRLASFTTSNVNIALPGATDVAVGNGTTLGRCVSNKSDGIYSTILYRYNTSTWYLISSRLYSSTSGTKVTVSSNEYLYCPMYGKTSYFGFPEI